LSWILLLQAPAQFSRVFWFLSHTCPLVQTKEKQLDWAIAYVQNQKIHHQNGSIVLSLEKDGE
jgi:hypothetical protein